MPATKNYIPMYISIKNWVKSIISFVSKMSWAEDRKGSPNFPVLSLFGVRASLLAEGC